MRSTSTFHAKRPAFWLGVAVMSVAALLPWWRNHDYLRDFYDYGMFVNVNARLAVGERPYVDFTTPVQSAMLLLDAASEWAGGGTYLGMTRGAAVLIVLGMVGLSLMLAQRWRPIWAVGVAFAVVIGSAGQHTIIVYNPLGVLALALVTWSFAQAPLLRRADLGWHALAGAGLFLGGMNKLNFHLVACTMAAGWVLLAWTGQRGSGRRALASLGFIFACGVILPFGAELAWTGASPRLWYHNVIEIPFLTRASRLSLLTSSRLYLTTVHDYYGTLWLPQAGLVGLWLAVMAAVAAWRSPTVAGIGWRRIFVLGAGGLAAGGGAALLVSNNEIAYVALSASVVLATSVWLGFGTPPRGILFGFGLLLPALILAVTGWDSAWRGQRSQFGHSAEPRPEYVAAESIGPDFGYLRGLHVPAGIAHSLAEAGRWRQTLPAEMRSRIFYGPGLEYLEHIWPARDVRGMAVLQNGFVNGPREQALFQREVLEGKTYRYLLAAEAWATWEGPVESALSRGFLKGRVGTQFFFYEKLPDQVVWARPLEFLPSFGGNVDTTKMISTLTVAELADGRRFVGTSDGAGDVRLTVPSYRASGQMVLRRSSTAGAGALGPVRFEIFAINGRERYSRWLKDATLAAGEKEWVFTTDRLDASGLPLDFTVTVPHELAGQLMAGWRELSLWDSPDGPEIPPLLVSGAWPAAEIGGTFRASILPSGLAGARVFVRNAWEQDGCAHVQPGGQIWIRLKGLYSKIVVVASPVAGPAKPATATLQIVYYKGGRLEQLPLLAIKGTTPTRFDAWSPASDGWLGLITGSDNSAPAITLKIESVERR